MFCKGLQDFGQFEDCISLTLVNIFPKQKKGSIIGRNFEQLLPIANGISHTLFKIPEMLVWLSKGPNSLAQFLELYWLSSGSAGPVFCSECYLLYGDFGQSCTGLLWVASN